MKIEQIKIQNFKVFHKTEVKDIPSMSVFLGMNGSGKTTFFDVFGFLSDALKYNVTTAVNRRGGYNELASKGHLNENIAIEIKFRSQEQGSHPPLVTYSLEIGRDNGKIVIFKELLKYRRGNRGRPWHFLEFEKGSGKAVKNEEDYGKEGVQEEREYQELDNPDILAIKGLGQFKQFKSVSNFRQLLERWYVSNLRIDAAQSIPDTGISQHLSTTGDNLSQVTKYIYEHHRDIFNSIIEKMKSWIKGIEDVKAAETEDGRIVLKFQDGSFKDPFIARYVSDGTIKMFAYLILLNEPEKHPLLCIEEPENYLHPALLWELVDEMREYAKKGGQIFISTHSPDLVNALALHELFWMVKEGGFTHIKRAKDDIKVGNLVAEGDQLGYLWNQGYLIGSSPA
ncbi:MAG: AAA family ATPase [Ekhidna sp.]|nr:AAA family ATPase [Ekhidna sp.]